MNKTSIEWTDYTSHWNNTDSVFELIDPDGEYLVAGYEAGGYYKAIQRVGKSKSGNLLDGKQHLNFPTI
jgi:hypothetical protein